MLAAPVVVLAGGLAVFAAVVVGLVLLTRLLHALHVPARPALIGIASFGTLGALVALVVTLMGAAAVAALTRQAAQGGGVSLGRSLLLVGRRLLPVGGTIGLYWGALALLAAVTAVILPLSLLLLPASLIASALWFARPGLRRTWLRRVLVAALPGGPLLYNAVRWGLCIPAAALDGLGPVAALRESSRRVAGQWFAVAILVGAPMALGYALLAGAAPLTPRVGLPPVGGQALAALIQLAIAWVAPALAAAAYLVRGGGPAEPAEEPAPAPVRVPAAAAGPAPALSRALTLSVTIALVLTAIAPPVLAATPVPRIGAGKFTCTGTPVVAFQPGSPQVAGTSVRVYDQNDSPGCTQPLYEFVLTPPGGSPTVVVPYPSSVPSSSSYTWDTTGLTPGSYTWTINLKDELGAIPAPPYDVTGSATFTVNAYNACTSAGLTQSPASPVAPGTSVTFTASSAGCPSPVYQFILVDSGGTQTVEQAFGSASTFALDTTALNGSYQMLVQAKNGDAPSTDSYDKQASDSFVVATCNTATILPGTASPQLVGASITFSAGALGCSSPTYQFSVTPPGGTAAVAQAYSASSTFNWNTTGLAPGAYSVAVDVATTSPGVPTLHAQTSYSIDVHCTGASLTTTLASPQPAGTSIPLSASATGCAFPLYSFSVSGGAGSQPYGSSASWNWATGSVSPGTYTITVNAVSAAANPATPDAQGTLGYQLTSIDTTIAVTVNPSTGIPYNQPSTITATVSGANSTVPGGGSVQFNVPGYSPVSVPLSGGQASLALGSYSSSFFPGSTYTISISYTGYGAYNTSYTSYRFTAQPSVTQTTITVTQDTTPGITQEGRVYYYVSATVALNPGSTITSTYANALQLVVDGSPVGSPQWYTGAGTRLYTTNGIDAATATCTPASLASTCPHTIAVEFLGNSYFAASTSAATTVNVPFAAISVAMNTSYSVPAYYSQQFSRFCADVTSGSSSDPRPTGTVTFYDGATAIGTASVGGVPPCNAQSGAIYLSATSHSVYAVYGGDADHWAGRSPSSVNFTINPTATSISSFTSDTTTGGAGVPVTFTVNVTTIFGTAPWEGQVQLQISNSTGTPATYYEFANVSGGPAVITLSNFVGSPGTYTVSASYSDPAIPSSFGSSVAAGSITITAPVVPTTLTISAPTIQYENDASICVTVAGVGGGIAPSVSSPVTLTVTNGTATTYTLAVPATGQVCISLTSPAIGTYYLQASFPGDSNYGASSTTPPITLVVTKRTPTITVGASPNPVVPTRAAVLSATVAGLSGYPVPTGTVTFSDGTTTLGTATLSGGTASISTSFTTEGAHTITVSYGDDTYYGPASATYTENVARVAPAVVIDSYPTSMVTGNATVVAALTEPLGPAPTGTMTLVDTTTSTTLATVTLTTNIGTLVGALSGAGDHSLTVGYSGDTIYAPVTSAPFTVTVNLASSSVVMTIPASLNFANPATIAASVIAPTGETLGPTGTITVWEGGQSCTIDASVPTGSCALTWDATGDVTVEADYSGDGVYAAASTTQTVYVAPGTVTISVTQPATWAIGQPVTLSWATVGPPDGDGEIDITANPGATGCAAQPLTGSCSFTLTGSGSIDVLIVYSGDPNWAVTSVELKPVLPGQLHPCYTLTVQVTPAAAGTVGTSGGAPCPTGAGYLGGSTVELLPNPASGYVFDSFSGPVDAFGNVSMTSNVFVLATFKAICHTLQLTPGLNTADSNGFLEAITAPNCGKDPVYDSAGNWNGLYKAGTSVTVDARPGSDANGPFAIYELRTGDSTSTASSVNVVMSKDEYVFARFGPPCFTVTVQPPASGGTLSVDTNSYGCLGGPGYPRGTHVAVTAIPNFAPGDPAREWWLSSWNVTTDVVQPDGSHALTHPDLFGTPPLPTRAQPDSIFEGGFTLLHDTTLAASFNRCAKLTIVTSDPGTVSANPAGSCPLAGDGWYLPGTFVALTGTGVRTSALTGTEILRWEGADSLPAIGANPSFGLPMRDTATLTVNGDTTVNAYFWDPNECSGLASGAQGAGTVGVSSGPSNCLPGQIETGVTLNLSATGKYSGEVEGFTIAYGTQLFATRGSQASWTKPGGNAPIVVTAWFCAGLALDGAVFDSFGPVNVPGGLDYASFVTTSVAPDCGLGGLTWVVPESGLAPSFDVSAKDAPPQFTVTGIGAPGAAASLAQLVSRTVHVGFDAGAYQRSLPIAVRLNCYKLSIDDYITAITPENCPGAPSGSHSYLPGTVVQMEGYDRGSRYELEGWSGVDAWNQLQAVVTMKGDENPQISWQDTEDPTYVAKGVLKEVGLTVFNMLLPEANQTHALSLGLLLKDFATAAWNKEAPGPLAILGLADLVFQGLDLITSKYGGGVQPFLPLSATLDLVLSPMGCGMNVAAGGLGAYADPADTYAGCESDRVNKFGNSWQEWNFNL